MAYASLKGAGEDQRSRSNRAAGSIGPATQGPFYISPSWVWLPTPPKLLPRHAAVRVGPTFATSFEALGTRSCKGEDRKKGREVRGRAGLALSSLIRSDYKRQGRP